MKNRSMILLILMSVIPALLLTACQNGRNVPTATPVIYLPTRSLATLPPPTQAPSCENRMVVDTDDYGSAIYIAAGAKFLQEWVVTNYSTCNWDEQYHLFFVSGNQMGAPDYVEIPHIPIGSKGKISIELTAPEEPGEYRSEWKLFGSDNRFFGESLVVEIVVQ